MLKEKNMTEQEVAVLRAVGVIHADDLPPERLRLGQEAAIEIFDPYLPALKGLRDHAYFWVLCWLDRSDRSVLQVDPLHRQGEGPYGVFGMRAPVRPNPISLTLVKLLDMEGNMLRVDGLDVFDKTPVVDIKPYIKGDVIFSPPAPFRPLREDGFMERYLYKKALRHHQEDCADLALAVRMALLAGERLGDVSADDVRVRVTGSACFADVIQGLTHARLANPPRFFRESGPRNACVWEKGNLRLITAAKSGLAGTAADVMALPLADLMDVRQEEAG